MAWGSRGILVLLFLGDVLPCCLCVICHGCSWLTCAAPHISAGLSVLADLWEHTRSNLQPWAEMMLCLWSTQEAGNESMASSSCRDCALGGPLSSFIPLGSRAASCELMQGLSKGDLPP